MNLLQLRRFIIPLLMLLLPGTICQAQSLDRPPVNKLVKGVSKRSPGSRKQYKIREPGSVTKAKRKQEADERKHDKEYKAQLKADRKRHLEIQTPEVRERIIQNRKEAETNYKAKKKAVASGNKKTGKKYR